MLINVAIESTTSPGSGRRQEARARLREVIFDAMWGLLRDRPLAALRMEEVATATGLSRQTLYNRFGGMDTLFRACCEQRIAELAQRTIIQVSPAADPVAALAAFTADMARLFADPDYTDLARQFVRLGPAYSWFEDACWRRLKLPLATAVENHILRHRRSFGAVDPRQAGQRLVTIVEGLAVWPALNEPAASGDTAFDDHEAARLVLKFLTAKSRVSRRRG